MRSWPLQYGGGSRAIIRPAPRMRGPLPPFDQPFPPDCPDCQIHTTLTQPVPPNPTLRWWRANAWSVQIPGLPDVPGGSTKQPERFLTGFTNRYPIEYQTRALLQQCYDAYTHWWLWAPDALAGTYGAEPQPLDQYVQTAKLVQAYGFYACHNLLSKVVDPHDATWDAHRAHVTQILTALINARAVDAVTIGMELDLWNIPGAPLQTIIDGVMEIIGPLGIPGYVHLSDNHASWQTNGTSEEDWWRIQASKPWPITGIQFQFDPFASAALMQARFNDLQRLFARIGVVPQLGHYFDPVPMEVLADLEFDGSPTEDDGDLRGYELCCTTFSAEDPVGPVVPMGYGNGGRLPNGAWL